MNCFVTGGMGFLGTHLANELVKRRHNVTIYDIDTNEPGFLNNNCQIIKGDVRDVDFMKTHLKGKDVVFHMSGLLGTSELFENPKEAIDNNVIGALNVILGCEQLGIKRIFLPTKPLEWHNIYSVTSQAIQKLGLSYNEYKNMEIRLLKFWNIYGPNQKIYPIRKAIPLFILQALHDKPLEIFGNGSQKIELLYAEDFSKIAIDFTLNIKTIDSEVYEIFSPFIISVKEIAKLIITLTNSKSTIKYLPMRSGEQINMEFERDLNVAKVLNRVTETPLLEGIAKTIDYYRKIPSSERIKILTKYE